MQYDLKNKKRPKWCAIYGIASPFQTETHLRSFVPVSRVVFCKRLKVSPYIWDSSRPCTSVNLNGGNGALRLAPDRPSVASDRRVLRSDPICKPKPIPFNQFFKTRCYTCFVQQVSPVTACVDSALPLHDFPFPNCSYDTCSTGRICTSPICERERGRNR